MMAESSSTGSFARPSWTKGDDPGRRQRSDQGPSVSQLLNEAPTSRFHRRAAFISGMGFFTDAYDLFVIATVATLVKTQWNLSTTQVSWVTGSAILGAFFGAVIFGRIADVVGRKSIYVLVAVIMIIGAVASALAPGFWF